VAVSAVDGAAASDVSYKEDGREHLQAIASDGENNMRPVILLAGTIMAGLVLLAPAASQAQNAREEIDAVIKDYLATHPDEVGEIAKGYLIRHPEAIGEILAEVLKHRPAKTSASTSAAPGASAKPAADRSGAVASNAAVLFSSPHQVTLGNPHGDVTLVEFFDYSCGFCKRALSDMLTLMKDDPNLKIVLKELPILGPGSGEAARVAVAVRMQDPEGQKYLAFHQELLGAPGPANKDRARAAEKDQGLDMARIEQDAASEEAGATLSEDMKLAGALGINGTPGYVVGDKVVLGAVGIAALKERIAAVRGHGVNN
jgi:protein-disulfide isomerase